MDSNSPAKTKTISLRYTFFFSDEHTKVFDLQLEKGTLSLVGIEHGPLPDWTKLSFHQCPNCPLKEDEHPRCPIAANVSTVIEQFKDDISFDVADVEISTDARTYKKRTSLQKSIASLVGIYMVTSGCPVMDKLRPMVQSHLPFATVQETNYRMLSMYLLAQFFRHKHGKKPDWEMKNLLNIFDQVSTVNRSFSDRLKAIDIQDASLNALVSLDLLADSTRFKLQIDNLDEIEQLFQAYLEET